jgi:Zn-dependent protease
VPLLVVGSSFVLHELLHKLTAQRYGFWSEFRANYVTLGLSILFAYVTHIVFAAPGATMIYGPQITKRQNGIISAAGPLLNLALGGLYLLLYLMTPPGGLLSYVGIYGFAINIWLSAFNLLPLGPLDGNTWRSRPYLLWPPFTSLSSFLTYFERFECRSALA